MRFGVSAKETVKINRGGSFELACCDDDSSTAVDTYNIDRTGPLIIS
jgi:hypothetical protein